MSAEQPHKDCTGVLFTNNPAKKLTEKSPDYGGEATLNGVRYRLAGWTKTGKQCYISLAFTPAKESALRVDSSDVPTGKGRL